MFGYQDMIVDFRGISMQQYATTVLGLLTLCNNQTAGVTGGRPDMIRNIAKAGIAVGDGIFIETHFDPAMQKRWSKYVAFRLF
jgi:2-dehydro-3-deoxyphosphooctonate aldolase (KDO 8-P synthase)